MIRVVVNNQPRELESTTVAALLQELRLNPRNVAVELNRRVIPQADHAACSLAANDSIEIVIKPEDIRVDTYRSSGKGGSVHLDPVTLALVAGIVLLGLVMVTSASVSIAGQESGEPFYYLERQLLLTLIGAGCAALLFCLPSEALEKAALPLLGLAIVLLVLGLNLLGDGLRRARES